MASAYNRNKNDDEWYHNLEWWMWALIALGGLFAFGIICCFFEVVWEKICGSGNSEIQDDKDEDEVTEITDKDEIG